jgi:hypothetical protein
MSSVNALQNQGENTGEVSVKEQPFQALAEVLYPPKEFPRACEVTAVTFRLM